MAPSTEEEITHLWGSFRVSIVVASASTSTSAITKKYLCRLQRHSHLLQILLLNSVHGVKTLKVRKGSVP